MEYRRPKIENPLGLSLDFMFGRGYLWAKSHGVSDWLTVDHLRMEIPDLSFPFDARGGLGRFRHTRCLVRDIAVSMTEDGIQELLRQAANHIQGFEDLEVSFLDGAIHISLRLRSFGADTFLSFRAALISPEPAKSDEVHLSLYDYRSYGPLPYPARLFAAELTARMLHTPVLRPPGRTDSFTVGISGDILRFRPLRLLLLHVFPKVGWKLPDLSSVLLRTVEIRPGGLSLRASSTDRRWSDAGLEDAARVSMTSAAGIAAYAAKDAYGVGDDFLFANDVPSAMQQFEEAQERLGLDPELAGRLLDCLLSDPNPENLARSQEICRDLLEVESDSLHVMLSRPAIALLSGRREQIVGAFEALSSRLKRDGETRDWTLCELAIAQYLEAEDAHAAEERLRGILRVTPRNPVALERLRTLYVDTERVSELEDVLKRLTGVYTDRERLAETYLALAKLLIDNDNPGEARGYLERVLRLDASRLEALDILGESYLKVSDPLRALKAFGTAARSAETQGELSRAGRLHYRIAKIWAEIGDPQQALLSGRRGLSLRVNSERRAQTVGEEIEELEAVADLCAQCGRPLEAIGYWTDSIGLLRSAIENALHLGSGAGFTYHRTASETYSYLFDIEQLEERLIGLHRRIASSYLSLERPAAAVEALRRILELAPQDEEARRSISEIWSDEPEKQLAMILQLIRRTSEGAEEEALQRQAFQLAGECQDWDEAVDLLVAVLTAMGDRLHDPMIWQAIVGDPAQLRSLQSSLVQAAFDATSPADRFPMLVHLGRLLQYRRSDPIGALEYLSEALRIRPDHGEVPLEILEIFSTLEEDDFVISAVGMTVRGLRSVLEEWKGLPDDRRASWLHEQMGLREQTEQSDVQLVSAEAEDGAITQEAEPARDSEVDPIAVFRERMDAAVRRSHAVPDREQLDPESPMGRILGRGTEPGSEAREEEQEVFAPPHLVGVSPSGVEEDTDRLPESSLSWPSDAEEISDADTAQARAEAALRVEDVPEQEVSFEAHQNRIERARVQSDFEDLALALAALLDADQQQRFADPIDEDLRRRLHRELGETLYYELDDWSASQRHLEYVYRNDPDGLGADPAVVNALESIYEDIDDVDGKLGILENKFRNAETPAMKTVYRLLIAQTAWELNRDHDLVHQWVEPILAVDPNHEGAHRLLAEVASQSGRDADAVQHLKTVLSVAAGGLDAVEITRTIAETYLHRLDQPRQGLRYFRAVLEEAPGDSQALDGVKHCQEKLEDWNGLIQSLSAELGLLLGRSSLTPDEVLALDPQAIHPGLRIPASQIVADVAHVLESQLPDLAAARAHWKLVEALWPEHVEALERSISIGKELGLFEEVCVDLIGYAGILLDPVAQFDALVECATLRMHELDQPEQARNFLAEALALFDDMDDKPEHYDEVRRQFQALS